MHLTLDKIQPILIEAYDLAQFIFAILGVISIPLLFFKHRSFDEDDVTTTSLPPDSFTLFLEKTCTQLGIPRLMMYIRPQAYYDNLSKQLNGKSPFTPSFPFIRLSSLTYQNRQ